MAGWLYGTAVYLVASALTAIFRFKRLPAFKRAGSHGKMFLMNVKAFSFLGDHVILSNPHELTYNDWKRLTERFNYLGYGLPSVDAAIDVYEALTAQCKAVHMPGYILQPDQAAEVLYLLGKKRPEIISKEEADILLQQASDYFGTTNDYRLAGYLLTDGTLLDFSEGQPTRVVDHRQIRDAFSETWNDAHPDRNAAMDYFMNCGNIRMTTRGMDIIREPTSAQYHRLSQIFRDMLFLNDECMIDYSNDKGLTIGSTYYRNATVEKIICDMKSYFRSYVVPKDYDRYGAYMHEPYMCRI